MELGIKSPARHDSTSGGSKVVSGEQLVKSAQKKVKSLSNSDQKEDSHESKMKRPRLSSAQLTPSRRATGISPQAISMDTSAPVPMDTGSEVVITSSEDECFSPSGPLKSPLSPRLSALINQAAGEHVFQYDAQIKQEPPSSELSKSLVQFCTEALGNSVLGLQELRDKLLLKQASVEENHPLRLHGVPDSQLEEALSTSGAMEVGQPCNKRLFALPNGNKVCVNSIFFLQFVIWLIYLSVSSGDFEFVSDTQKSQEEAVY